MKKFPLFKAFDCTDKLYFIGFGILFYIVCDVSVQSDVDKIVNISLYVYGPSLVVKLETQVGIVPSHLTNVFVKSIDFLTVSDDVSNTSLKSILLSSDTLNIIKFLSVYSIVFIIFYNPNLPFCALKFCETSVAVSALL
jgi:hypothetical protein